MHPARWNPGTNRMTVLRSTAPWRTSSTANRVGSRCFRSLTSALVWRRTRSTA